MIAAIRDWLPITVRNRIALGFVFLGLLIFVIWNFLPFSISIGGAVKSRVYEEVWSEVFDFDKYLGVIKSPSFDHCAAIAAYMALIQNALVLIIGLPIWRTLHASNYLRVPLAVVNLMGGLVVLKFCFKSYEDGDNIHKITMFGLTALSMMAVFVAMVIFKNELGLRHEREVKKTI